MLTSYTDLIADVTNIVIDGVSVLQNRQYSSDLADPNTPAYQSLEQEFCAEVGFELFTIIPPFGKSLFAIIFMRSAMPRISPKF